MENIWITDAEYIKNYELRITFNNGKTGKINLENHLYLPIFEPLQDILYFKNFKLGTWTISWPNGADFAPEFLYTLIKKEQAVY